MLIDLIPETYTSRRSAAFMRTRAQYGNLSNMSGGFPLTVHDTTFQSPEGLYQALKFPTHPNLQKTIGAQRSGMEAKRSSYTAKTPVLPDWDHIRIQAMVYTTAVKLAQHPQGFTQALMETADLTIVEKSIRDDFWGAMPNGQTLRGVNTLGKILTKTRDLLRHHQGDTRAAIEAMMSDIPIDTFFINSQPITTPETAQQQH